MHNTSCLELSRSTPKPPKNEPNSAEMVWLFQSIKKCEMGEKHEDFLSSFSCLKIEDSFESNFHSLRSNKIFYHPLEPTKRPYVSKKKQQIVHWSGLSMCQVYLLRRKTHP